jgi:hypothetical protein
MSSAISLSTGSGLPSLMRPYAHRITSRPIQDRMPASSLD